jgi:hypothetical protein
MSLVELLPNVRALPRTDRIRLIQLLAEELASEEATLPLASETEYPVWSPYDSFAAAATLHEFLCRTEDAGS